MAERFVLTSRQLVLQGRRAATSRKLPRARHSEFSISPATGRDWVDAGRSALDIDKGPYKARFVSFFASLCNRIQVYRIFSEAVSACSCNQRDEGNSVFETSDTNYLILWPKALSTRHRKEAYCPSMVPTNHRCPYPEGHCHHQSAHLPQRLA